MKRIITSLLSIGFLTCSISAQLNIQIKDADGNIQNGSTYYFYGPSTGTLQQKFYCENMNVDSTVISVKRYETNVQPNTSNFFCWGICFNPQPTGTHPLWDMEDTYSINMATDTVYPDFAAYHQPAGNIGVSCYRYVWYALDAPDDSTWVDICFDTETVGIGSNEIVSDLNVYPNPSLGSVNFDIALDASVENAELVIHNLLGEHVWGKTVSNKEQKIVLKEGELTPGVYFYSIQTMGRIAITEKLIIGQQ